MVVRGGWMLGLDGASQQRQWGGWTVLVDDVVDGRGRTVRFGGRHVTLQSWVMLTAEVGCEGAVGIVVMSECLVWVLRLVM
eukprot:3940482-Rhodomonas_salina.2